MTQATALTGQQQRRYRRHLVASTGILLTSTTARISSPPRTTRSISSSRLSRWQARDQALAPNCLRINTGLGQATLESGSQGAIVMHCLLTPAVCRHCRSAGTRRRHQCHVGPRFKNNADNTIALTFCSSRPLCRFVVQRSIERSLRQRPHRTTLEGAAGRCVNDQPWRNLADYRPPQLILFIGLLG